ncbi:MAG: ribonuclease P protein component [Ginsengibacter sp.]
MKGYFCIRSSPKFYKTKVIKKEFTLGAGERIKSRKAILSLFEKGSSFSIFPIRVVYILEQTSENNGLKAAFTASKKNFKKAVDRNRIRRLMKESWRLQKNELQLCLQSSQKSLDIFFIYTGKELPEYQFICRKMEEVIQKMQGHLADHKNKSV